MPYFLGYLRCLDAALRDLMKLFKQILVPTDFEACSAEALGVAIGLARAFDGKVTILHVWQIPVYPYMVPALNSELISSVQERAADRLAQELHGLRMASANAEALLKTGTASDGILEATKEMEPDLIVMGTHGHRGVRHGLLGSVAEKIVRISTVPVLTVRSPLVEMLRMHA
jgi:nucleotide-binding universal stress UspA family protein